MITFFKKQPVDFDDQLVRTCKNCSAEFKGRYCNHCGEKVVEPYERSIRFFLDSVFNAFTFVEGKFWNTLKTIFRHPGQYSLDFGDGIRQRYMKPIAFFFVGNVIYFLFPIFVKTFATPLHNHPGMEFYGGFASEWIESRLLQEHVTFEEFAIRFDPQAVNLAKTMLVLIIPIFALLASLINFSRARYFSDHLLFSAEFNAYMIFCNLVFLPFILLGLNFIFELFSFTPLQINDTVLVPIISTTSMYFLVRAERRCYGLKWWRAILKGTILFGCFFITLQAFRFILFVLTMWSI